MKVAEEHGSLVSVKDFPENWQDSRPYRPHDFAEEWKHLKKAWNLHRNKHEKLRDRKIEEGSAEFYANDPLNNTQDWLWRFCLFLSQPAFEESFRDAFKVVQDNREKPVFKAFFREYEENYAPNRADKYLAIIREFFLAYDDLRRIRALNRFDAELKPMISALPSYTQLGMAALLPNRELSFASDGGGSVLSGGESTQDLAAREKILATGRAGDRAKALSARDVLDMRVDEGKELFRDNDVVYIYHNLIDAIGDKLQTEDQLPKATIHTYPAPVI